MPNEPSEFWSWRGPYPIDGSYGHEDGVVNGTFPFTPAVRKIFSFEVWDQNEDTLILQFDNQDREYPSIKNKS